MSHAKVNISIVVYKQDITEIEHLIETLDKNNFTVYLIDNSPTDELRKAFLTHKNIQYVFNGKNLGYGTANNIAINETIKNACKYHLVLNPDIIFEIEVLQELIVYMDSHPNVGLCMPNIVYPNLRRQHLCKLLPTPWNLFARRFGLLKKWNKKINDKFELKHVDYNVDFSAPSLSGCFMFMRTSVLEKIGGFDERYFMYCEDIDLSRRIHQVSDTFYVPTKPVIHEYNKASYKLNKMVIYHIVSATKYFNKWGWFFDTERKKVNEKILEQLKML